MTDEQRHELTMLTGYKVDFDNDGGFITISRSPDYGEISVAEIIEKCPFFRSIPEGYIWRSKLNNCIVIG